MEMYTQRLTMSREIGDQLGEMHGLNGLGLAERMLGDIPRAQQNFEQTLTIARAVGFRTQEAQALSNLGLIASDQGDASKADYWIYQLLS